MTLTQRYVTKYSCSVGEACLSAEVNTNSTSSILRKTPWVSALVHKRFGLDEDLGLEPETDVLDEAIDEAINNVPRLPWSDEDEGATEATGDDALVRRGLAAVADAGNGAMRQRRAWRRRHDVGDVLAVAAEATLEF